VTEIVAMKKKTKPAILFYVFSVSYFFCRRVYAENNVLEIIKILFDLERGGIYYSAPYFPGAWFLLRGVRDLCAAAQMAFRNLDEKMKQAEVRIKALPDQSLDELVAPYYYATLHHSSDHL